RRGGGGKDGGRGEWEAGERAYAVVLPHRAREAPEQRGVTLPPLWREDGAVGVRARRLQDDDAGPRAPQRRLQVVDADAFRVDTDRHRLETGRTGRGERADIRRRLDQHGIPRAGEGAEDDRERRLASRGDEDVSGRN